MIKNCVKVWSFLLIKELYDGSDTTLYFATKLDLHLSLHLKAVSKGSGEI